MIWPFLKVLCMKHWIKTTFVLAPLFFSGRLLDHPARLFSVMAFFAFIFSSDNMYIFNDDRNWGYQFDFRRFLMDHGHLPGNILEMSRREHGLGVSNTDAGSLYGL